MVTSKELPYGEIYKDFFCNWSPEHASMVVDYRPGVVLLFWYGSIMVRHISANVMLQTDSLYRWSPKRTSGRNTVYN